MAPTAATWQTSTSAPSLCSSCSQVICLCDSRSPGPFTSTSWKTGFGNRQSDQRQQCSPYRCPSGLLCRSSGLTRVKQTHVTLRGNAPFCGNQTVPHGELSVTETAAERAVGARTLRPLPSRCRQAQLLARTRGAVRPAPGSHSRVPVSCGCLRQASTSQPQGFRPLSPCQMCLPGPPAGGPSTASVVPTARQGRSLRWPPCGRGCRAWAAGRELRPLNSRQRRERHGGAWEKASEQSGLVT